MRNNPVIEARPLGFPWHTVDPFLFCVHHDDAYPRGNDHMGPNASLAGRDLGQDFEGLDGWRMYHGESVPGFPQHPHRGFETITMARRGFIDHSDSLGATARFGGGDVQWMTAGAGVVHSEMFPLLKKDAGNPVELFQIWMNLPAADKMVPPHFTMLWDGHIPRRTFTDDRGRSTLVTVVAGALDGLAPPSPPPHSWASRADADVAIFTLRMDAGARWTLPKARGKGTRRTLYFFAGGEVLLAGQRLQQHAGVEVDAGVDLELQAGDATVEMLMLQGRPIAEPVVQYGPFVMNTQDQIRQAYADFQRTRFGGWPWPKDDPVHPREAGRFARHADGREEKAPG